MESLECPRCGCRMSKVLETRWLDVGTKSIKVRKRQCRHCKKQYLSKEVIDSNIELPTHSRRKPKPAPKPDLPPDDNPFL